MRRGQTLTHQDYEVALFPMESCNITQGRNGPFSHQGINAYDLAGRDSGVEDILAPFTLRYVWKDTNQATGIVAQNVTKVLLANGKVYLPGQISLMCWHDDDIRDIRIGDIVPQGQPFYQEGRKGFATGNHVHMEICEWVYDSYPLYKLLNGNWTLKGRGINLEDCFFIDDTVMISGLGYHFKRYSLTTARPVTPAPMPKLQDLVKEVPQNVTDGGFKVRLKTDAYLWNYDFKTWAQAKALDQFRKGDIITVSDTVKNSLGGKYFITEFARKNKLTHGFNAVDCEVIS